ncbi:MAG TPA: 6-phosphofructokinase [Candidatus Fimimorpha faecalis]|mgnify:CR=1 FL=1|uniref:Pyrophosphate--fructose 6-phosphate 1-phosphotransferase n=1 Tax=Candidatus Fimimorpha faecalis TaxID=2840824 RepID=A0A9D1EEX8_9FIRM|nr:6-phosphofructokinase [Candidatus Fimimorpha faecalis]
MMKKNLLVGQSGGPTAAINATLAGVLSQAQISEQIDIVYGAFNGIEGVMQETFVNLTEKIPNTDAIHLLRQTPSAALGSCRYKLKDYNVCKEEYQKILDVFRKYNIGYFVYIGGNDSMDTVMKLSQYFKQEGISDIFIMGAPKTIDNDLMGTDHCPGFGSAAKYIATTFAELVCDTNAYMQKSVTVVEVMGRNAGWLTASSALARLSGGKGPDLIYLCERPFSCEQFLVDVRNKLEKQSSVLIAVSEGIHDENGVYISEQTQSGQVDNFGHKYIAGAARSLEEMIRNEIGCKVRSIELNLMQRAAGHIASQTDLEESYMLGSKAVTAMLEGKTGEMSAIRRLPTNDYKIETFSIPIEQIANHEKKIPLSWINEAGNDVTPELMNYLTPLIQGEVNVRYQNGIPMHITLK